MTSARTRAGRSPSPPGVLFVVVLAMAVLFAVVATAATDKESNYHTEDLPMYEPAGQEWNYKNFSKWPELCHTGQRQSPISFKDLNASSVAYSSTLEDILLRNDCYYNAHKTTLRRFNDVNTLTISMRVEGSTFDDPSDCTVNDPITLLEEERYTFSHLLFHAKAEHVFPRADPDAELHMVFESASPNSERQLILAILLTAVDSSSEHVHNKSASQASIKTIDALLTMGRLPPPMSVATSTTVFDVDLIALIPEKRSYLTYAGSLTTPPCTEDVRFVVFTVPQFMSTKALDLLRDALAESMPKVFKRGTNVRPPQPLNNRTVYRFVDPHPTPYKRNAEGKKDKARQDIVHGKYKAELGLDIYSDEPINNVQESESPKKTQKHNQSVKNVNETSDAKAAATQRPQPNAANTTSKNPLRNAGRVAPSPQHSPGLFVLSIMILLVLVGGVMYWRWYRDTVYVGIDDDELAFGQSDVMGDISYGTATR